MSTDLANSQKAQRDHEESTDTEDGVDPIDVDPYSYPLRRAAGADALAFALACLSDRERQLVELVDAGYSHAEIATMMGYSSARSVTTTLNRIRDKAAIPMASAAISSMDTFSLHVHTIIRIGHRNHSPPVTDFVQR
jgi:DNA-directed RNA polymerase specialized sigma24 family protein